MLSVPAASAANVKPKMSNASDVILQEMRRWQREQDARQFKHSNLSDRKDHPEFAARRRHLVRSRSAIDMPDEVPIKVMRLKVRH